MSSVRLGWQSAEVKDARLTVALEGEVPDGWEDSFERTVKLLGDGDWGSVKLKKGTVEVSDVAPGTEDKLRHHLEAIVAQANAAHAQDDEEDDNGDDAAEETPQGPDADMTERFRGFAEDEHDEEGEDGD